MPSSLAATLFSRAQAAILGLLYSHPDESYYLRRIVSLTGLGVGHVQRELARLAAGGIISREERDRHVYFQANASCPIFPELRGIVTKTIGAVEVIRQALFPCKDKIRVAFVFGSVARGQESSASDIDLMVIGNITFRETIDALHGSEAKLLRSVNPVVYPPSEFRDKLAQDHHFLTTVVRNEKLFVLGDPDELAGLSPKPLGRPAPNLPRRNPATSVHRRSRHRTKRTARDEA